MGQRLAVERLIDTLQKGGALAPGLVGEHDTPSHQAIDFARLRVVAMRWRGEWRQAPEPIGVRESIDKFLVKHGLGRYMEQ